MVAPAPTGASDERKMHTAQEPPQEREEDKVNDTGRATPDDITVNIAALSVRAADDTIGSKPTPSLMDYAQPQATQNRNNAFTSNVALMTYEETIQPGRPPGGGLDDFATAAEALAYVNDLANEAELQGDAELEDNANTQDDYLNGFATAAEALEWVNDPANEHDLIDEGDPDSGHIETAAEFEAALREFTTLYDPEDAEPHWSDNFDTFADFMAAAYGGDDSDTEN